MKRGCHAAASSGGCTFSFHTKLSLMTFHTCTFFTLTPPPPPPLLLPSVRSSCGFAELTVKREAHGVSHGHMCLFCSPCSTENGSHRESSHLFYLCCVQIGFGRPSSTSPPLTLTASRRVADWSTFLWQARSWSSFHSKCCHTLCQSLSCHQHHPYSSRSQAGGSGVKRLELLHQE